MNFTDMCQKRYETIKSNLCVGFDPDISKFPDKFKSMTIEESISLYFSEIMLNFSKYIYVIKPNVAFYEQYGFEGLKALKNIIQVSRDLSIPVILDAKRGDIGNTAKAYALSVFKEFGADAVTLSPYLGEDSLTPFFEYKNKGFFILARTSNKSGGDFQLQKVGDKYLYMIVAEKIAEWNKKYSPSIGAVAGATSVEELKNIAGYFRLIPVRLYSYLASVRRGEISRRLSKRLTVANIRVIGLLLIRRRKLLILIKAERVKII